MDEILHAVTNRNDFVSDAYFSGAPFSPSTTEADDVTQLRELLCLDVTSTDYYVHGVMMALDCYPDIRRRLPELNRSYEPLRYQRPSDTIEPGSLATGANQGASLHHVPTEFPVPFTWTLTRTTQNRAVLKIGTRSWEVIQGISSDNILGVEWPSGIGISGVLDLSRFTGGWDAAGDVIKINHEPCAYPYDAVVALVQPKTSVQQLLNRAGTLEGFTSARTSLEKVAFLGLTVGLLHDTIWGSNSI